MGIFALCDNDPLIETLASVFHANIVRVPEQRIQPACVIGAVGKRLAFRGALDTLLTPVPNDPIGTLQVQTSRLADVAGKKSRRVSLDLGLDVLRGFLGGFGVPAFDVAAHFTGASEVSFSFQSVERRYLDPGRLGQALAQRVLDTNNPAVGIFVAEDPWDCLIIDSVITSSDFSIAVERSRSADFSFDVPAVQQIVAQGQGQVAVTSSAQRSLTFRGPQPLTFAFTCQRLLVEPSGRIIHMPPDDNMRSLSGQPDLMSHATSGSIQLSPRPAMLEWDATSV